MVDSEGRTRATGRQPCTHPRTTPGVAEHDPRAWFEEVAAAARAALDQIDDPDAITVIGIGAVGPAPVLLDSRLEPLAAAPLWSMDARADPYRPKAAGLAGVDDLDPDHVLIRHLWWQEEMPETYAQASWVVDATGYLVARLTGQPVMDRITVADHLIDGVDPPVAVPEPAEPLSLAGSLTGEAASALGLAPGIPVAVGTYDTYVDLYGLGVVDPRSTGLLMGSTFALGSVTTDEHAPDGLRACPHIGPGWFVGGWTSSAGTALDWATALTGRDRAELMTEAERLLPGAGGLLALPYWDGERAPVWDPQARGVIVGLNTATTPGEVYRAMIDGIALATLDVYRRLPAAADFVRVAGGGTRNPAWLHATADALGVPLRAADELTSGVGAAYLALAATGRPRPEPRTRTIEPDPERHARLEALFDLYQGLYDSLASRMHRLGALDASARASRAP